MPFNFSENQHRYWDQNCSQEASILPITNSVKSSRGVGIGVSIGSKSKAERSNSREHRKPIFSKDPSLNSSEGFRVPKPLERRESNRTDAGISTLVRKISSPEDFSFKPQSEKESSQAKLYCSNILDLMK